MIRVLLVLLVLLSGCAGRPPLPEGLPDVQWPLQLHVQRALDGQTQDWLLIVQQEHTALRWSMMDPLGIPEARQLLVGSKWQADGLLPPNPAARELFAAVLFALTPQAELGTRYPKALQTGARRQLGERWVVDYRSTQDFSLLFDKGLRYRITPLDNESTP